ncbi:MAG: NAD(P)/FAD-dependent oxidoreductase, partial [Flavobacteriales bacterium]
MSSKKHNYLVVGQGLAGTLVSWKLHQRGANFHVIDEEREITASKVAAGMWNPISFRKVIPTWEAATMMNHVNGTYPEMEKELGVSFVHQREVLRFFPNDEYAQTWQKQVQKPEVAQHLGEPKELAFPLVDKPHGCVVNAGYVDINTMIHAWRESLSSRKQYNKGSFSEVKRDKDNWVYKGVEYTRVILCLGVGMLDLEQYNLDGWLRTNKGEVITLDLESKVHQIVNNGKWLLPLEGGGYKLGASYDWRVADEKPTDEVREVLLEKMSQMVQEEPIIKLHEAGLRPTTKDRRPLVGSLDESQGLYIFNGLGTRGVLIGPYCAEELMKCLDGDVFDMEVNTF